MAKAVCGENDYGKPVVGMERKSTTVCHGFSISSVSTNKDALIQPLSKRNGHVKQTVLQICNLMSYFKLYH